MNFNALLQEYSMWLLKVNLLSNITPRYLTTLDHSTELPFKHILEEGRFATFLFVVKKML